MRYICSVTTDGQSGELGDTVGCLEAESAPQIGSTVSVTVSEEDGLAQQVSGELYAILEEGELWW